MSLFNVRSMLFALVVAGGCGSGDGPSTPVEPAVERRVALEPKPGFVTPSAPVKQETPVVEELAIPEKASEAMKLGKELAAKGKHEQARKMFEAAAKQNRKSADPQLELARSYIATNDKALALKAATKAVKLAPESSGAFNTLGRAELLRHDYDAAVTAFRTATALNPKNVWAWNNLGLVYLTLEHYHEAVAALEESTKHKGTAGYMWNNLGLAYEQLDQLDDARDAFEAGAKLGSVAAKASRKRLDGVDTIVVAKQPKSNETKAYDDREEMPEVPADLEGGDDDIEIDPTDDEAAEAAETKSEAVEENSDEAKPVDQTPDAEQPKPITL